MSDQGLSAQLDARLQSSHVRRARFENIAYMLSLCIVLCTAMVLLFGIAYPPPVPNTNAIDWGMAIVAKAKDAVPVLFTLLGALGVGTGITLTRGHLDARLSQ